MHVNNKLECMCVSLLVGTLSVQYHIGFHDHHLSIHVSSIIASSIAASSSKLSSSTSSYSESLELLVTSIARSFSNS